MASEGTGWFKSRRTDRPSNAGLRVLTAASSRIDLRSRTSAKQQRAMRQGWQGEAWAYRDSIGELRYALNFTANCMSRMRLFPAAYPIGGDSDMPIPLTEIPDAPPEIIAACDQAMIDLGNGRLAVSSLLHSLSTNLSVAGECFMLGQEDPQTGRQSWTVRSIDELVIYADEFKLREVPMDPNGILGWQTLDPDLTVAHRMWIPHPRYRLLADSALRAIMDDCDALLISRRGIRAAGRSRLAARGLLLIPNELSIKRPNNDNGDPQADDFLGPFTEAMMEPIADEGVASAVVPIVGQGPGEWLDKVRLIDFAMEYDKMAGTIREELVGIIATGLDMPREIVEGVADMNHWSAWQVDDNTFRHHIEPHVETGVDCLTGGYLRPYLMAANINPDIKDQWIERCLIWYDPVELVTHPDQTSDALNLHDRGVLSNRALLRVAGFKDTDAPTPPEFLAWLISKQRTWPANISAAVLHDLDPSLAAPPITVSGTVPGIKPATATDVGGVDTGNVAPPTAPPEAPVGPPQAPASLPAAPDTPQPGPPAVSASGDAAFDKALLDLYASVVLQEEAVTAASAKPKPSAQSMRLSRRLASIDADLRARLQTAANAAMLRQLEKAGGRLRNKVAKNEALRRKIHMTRNEFVAATLGETVVAAGGMTAADLMDTDWEQFGEQFDEWVAAAQRDALATACRLAGISTTSKRAAAASERMSRQRADAWKVMKAAMDERATSVLYQPHPDKSVDIDAMNPDTLVPASMIRMAIAIAGGAKHPALGAMTAGAKGGISTFWSEEKGGTISATFTGQIGTGDTIGSMLGDTGAQAAQYEWVHGPSLRVFEPHEDLDGVEFVDFSDDVLANPGDWPNTPYFYPGDHDGCLCDVTPLWMSAADLGIDTGDEGDGGEDFSGEGDAESAPTDEEGATPDMTAPVSVTKVGDAVPAKITPTGETKPAFPKPEPEVKPDEPHPDNASDVVAAWQDTFPAAPEVPLDDVMDDETMRARFNPPSWQIDNDVDRQIADSRDAMQDRSLFPSLPETTESGGRQVFSANLTFEESGSVKNYLGSNYEWINNPLRWPNEYKENQQWYAETHAAQIDAAIAKSPIGQDTVVFRGVGGNMEDIAKTSLNVGDKFDDPGFVSTSMSQAFADRWAGNGDTMVIMLDKGQPALGICKQEGELLLPRGTEFRIQRIEELPPKHSWSEPRRRYYVTIIK